MRVRGRRGRGVLARLWRFLQVTATGVITRDSKYSMVVVVVSSGVIVY